MRGQTDLRAKTNHDLENIRTRGGENGSAGDGTDGAYLKKSWRLASVKKTDAPNPGRCRTAPADDAWCWRATHPGRPSGERERRGVRTGRWGAGGGPTCIDTAPSLLLPSFDVRAETRAAPRIASATTPVQFTCMNFGGSLPSAIQSKQPRSDLASPSPPPPPLGIDGRFFPESVRRWRRSSP